MCYLISGLSSPIWWAFQPYLVGFPALFGVLAFQPCSVDFPDVSKGAWAFQPVWACGLCQPLPFGFWQGCKSFLLVKELSSLQSKTITPSSSKVHGHSVLHGDGAGSFVWSCSCYTPFGDANHQGHEAFSSIALCASGWNIFCHFRQMSQLVCFLYYGIAQQAILKRMLGTPAIVQQQLLHWVLKLLQLSWCHMKIWDVEQIVDFCQHAGCQSSVLAIAATCGFVLFSQSSHHWGQVSPLLPLMCFKRG